MSSMACMELLHFIPFNQSQDLIFHCTTVLHYTCKISGAKLMLVYAQSQGY